MTSNDWIQLVLVFCRAGGCWPSRWAGTWPASIEGKPCGLDRALGWLERGIYRVAGIDPQQEMGWRQVRGRRAAVQRASGFWRCTRCCDCRACCRSIRKAFPANTPDLAFNTAASFATNTNWQSYGGETTMSYLSQMLGLTVQNFVSAAAGMAVLVALIRGLARRSAATIGNFWFDLVRSTVYILLPLSIVVALDSGVAGRHSEFQAVRNGQRAAADDGSGRHEPDDAVAGDGPGRVADCDQAARHERRRVLQRELGASVRESHAAVELRRAAVDSADFGRRCVTRSA